MRTLIVGLLILSVCATQAGADGDVTGGGGEGVVYVVREVAPRDDGGGSYDPEPTDHAGPTCTMVVTYFHFPGGFTWVENGVSYRTGVLACSDGTTRTATICVANCPNGSAFFVRPNWRDALAALEQVLPRPRLSPTLEHARTGTAGGYIVGIPMYIAVQAADWRPLRATAKIPGYQITLVATPIRLDVTIGTTSISCDGPGEIVTGANWRTTTSNCRHVFLERGDQALTMTIVYKHEYTANFTPEEPLPIGEIGTSPTDTETLPVVEVQVVVESITNPPRQANPTKPSTDELLRVG
jgi:hypothetical protein